VRLKKERIFSKTVLTVSLAVDFAIVCSEGCVANVSFMVQIPIKTQNPKCRLYWSSIEFIDWSYRQSCWYFRPLLWTSAPLTFSLVGLPPSLFPSPSLPCVNKYKGMYFTVCRGGGWMGSGCVESIYMSYTL
jgi:hypothetical protein